MALCRTGMTIPPSCSTSSTARSTCWSTTTSSPRAPAICWSSLPARPHAFAAHHNSTAEALIIATPGIERFDYFRHVVRRRQGSEQPGLLLGLQDRFDTHFLDSPAWQRARAAA
jgi:hypothetical protein